MADVTAGGGDQANSVSSHRSQVALEFAEEFADLLGNFLKVASIAGEEYMSRSWRNDLMAGLETFTERDNPVMDRLRMSAEVLLELKTKLEREDPDYMTYRSLVADVAQAEAKVRRATQRVREQQRRGSQLRVDQSVVTVRVREDETASDLADDVDQVAKPDVLWAPNS